MRVFRAVGTFFDVQADAHRAARGHGTTFETIVIPFEALPRSEFVAWLNFEKVHLERGPKSLAREGAGLAAHRRAALDREQIATQINCAREHGESLKFAAQLIASHFRQNDPAFDQARFLSSCGYPDTAEKQADLDFSPT